MSDETSGAVPPASDPSDADGAEVTPATDPVDPVDTAAVDEASEPVPAIDADADTADETATADAAAADEGAVDETVVVDETSVDETVVDETSADTTAEAASAEAITAEATAAEATAGELAADAGAELVDAGTADEAADPEFASEPEPLGEVEILTTAPVPSAPVGAGDPVAQQLDPADDTWWQNAVFYQIYPRSFSDLDGDGIGDLAGVIDKLGYLELLGIDAIWLSPIMRSPMADHGYDVSDPRDIDPLFGDLADFDDLIADAHDRGIRVTMDLVPNHTSDQHEWFTAALAAGPGSPERERYIFRDGRGEHGEEPPNNWLSVFGGPAWRRVTEADGTPGQWYMHIFAPEQPDLNWDNPEVFDDLETTLRFWLNRGVDGFRIDVAHGMAKPTDLPDMDLATFGLLVNSDDDPRFNNDAVHDIHRKIRKVLDEYPGAANVGEIWVEDNERFAEYLRPDELHLGFNFRLAKAPFDAAAIRVAIESSLDSVLSVAGTPTWTLSNHDVDREVSRYGHIDQSDTSSAVDIAVGTARARAMALVEFALPGTVFIYNGAELGLPNVDLPEDALQDPVWERSEHTERGRDGCRVPFPWEGAAPPYGFSTTEDTWLPMPDDWAALTAESELEDISSTLSLYRQAIEMRTVREEFSGETVEWYGAPEGCLAFRRSTGGLICALNAGTEPVPLPPGQVILVSAPLVDGMLAPDAAAWLV